VLRRKAASRVWLTAVLVWLLFQLAAGYGSNLPSGTAAGTATAALSVGVAAALIVVLCWRASLAAPSSVQRSNTRVRAHARRTAFLPQRDPDASGRTRPRAPGPRRATA
jgi:hypothetical protein